MFGPPIHRPGSYINKVVDLRVQSDSCFPEARAEIEADILCHVCHLYKTGSVRAVYH